jgi:hypothetical protein
MADKKITELVSLEVPSLEDVLAIVDIAAEETKKVTVEDLLAVLQECPAAGNLYSDIATNNAGVGIATNGSMYYTGGLTVSDSGVEGVDGYYYPDGLYAGKPSWKQYAPSTWAVWWSVGAGQWRLSSVKGTLGTDYWSTSGNTPHDSWTPEGAGNAFSIPLDVWILDSDSLKVGYVYVDNLAEKTAGSNIKLGNHVDLDEHALYGDYADDSGNYLIYSSGDGEWQFVGNKNVKLTGDLILEYSDIYIGGYIYDSLNQPSIDPNGRYLIDTGNNARIDYSGSTYTLDINTGNLNVAGDYYSGGNQGYTGDMYDASNNKLATVVGGIITSVEYTS